MSEKTAYVETFGCQMNVLDSELVTGRLCRMGYALTEDMNQADLALLNTCSVRQHAEEKVYSRLGQLGRVKRDRPGMIIGVIGCMAQRDPDAILSAMPHVDLVCGPGRLAELPELIQQVERDRRRATLVSDLAALRRQGRDVAADDPLEQLDMYRDAGRGGPAAFVRIQRGCDKFCSFCVVPYVRGPEQSRPPANIVEETRLLADAGVRQVTLLGQSVNSYHYRNGSQSVRLSELLARVHEVDRIDRIRFVTSYPGDFDLDILYAMRDLPKVCEYLHIPAQSGSDRTLKAMRRHYTVGRYDELIEQARQIVPDISLAGDFIVGFPGETEDDFQATCELVRRTRYKNIFVFRYSPRPGTTADRKLPDEVPLEVKRRRNADLLAIQQQISLEQNRALIGRRVEVLVEGYSSAARKARRQRQAGREVAGWRDPTQLTGRTRGDQIVVFDGPERLVGELVDVSVTDATALTLHGRLDDPSE